jgi:hypothetical protein
VARFEYEIQILDITILDIAIKDIADFGDNCPVYHQPPSSQFNSVIGKDRVFEFLISSRN